MPTSDLSAHRLDPPTFPAHCPRRRSHLRCPPPSTASAYLPRPPNVHGQQRPRSPLAAPPPTSGDPFCCADPPSRQRPANSPDPRRPPSRDLRKMSTEAATQIFGGSELTTMPLLEQLAEVFGKLKDHTEVSLRLQSGMQWEDIKAHFMNLEELYRRKFDDLEEKQKALEEKKAEDRRLIAEKEDNVSAKEHASVNQLQELRDSAVSALAEVRQKYKVELAEILDANGSKDKKVITSTNDTNTSRASEHTPANGLGEPSEASPVEAKPRPALKQFCEQMDTKGLLKFLSDNWKKLNGLRDGLSVALRCASDPARFVLDCLEGFYPENRGSKYHSIQGQRRSCIVLLEALAHSLGMKELGGNHPWSSEIMEQAKAIAEEWKSKLAEADLDASDGYSLEAQAFLQLLTTFSVDLELDEDELCKIVVAVSRRKYTADLCRSLGLTGRIPGIIDELVKRHRQIDAIQFIQAFELSESFPTAPLLKAYVDELKDLANNNGDGNATSSMEDVKNRELLALRAIIKCVEEYKLQKDCPLGPLQKRVSELKPKGEKRPSVESGRANAKKPRVAGISAARRPTGSISSAPRRPAVPVGTWQRPPPPMPSYPDRYGVAPDRYHYTSPATAYDAAPYASYGEQYGALKPYQYNPGSVAPVSYNSTQYKVTYGGPGAQPTAGGYAAYNGAAGQAPSSSYLGYTGSGYRPSQQP